MVTAVIGTVVEKQCNTLTVQSKLETIASVVDVPLDKAKKMVAIQPGLLFETDVS